MTNRIFDNFFSTSILSHLSDNDTSIVLWEVPSDWEWYLVIEPNISNKREIIYYHSTNWIDTVYVDSNWRWLRGSANVWVWTEHLPWSAVEMNITAQHMSEYDEVKDTLNKWVVQLTWTSLWIIISPWKWIIWYRDVQTDEVSKILNDNKITYIELKPNDDVNSIAWEVIYTEFPSEIEANWTKWYKKLAIVRTVTWAISSIDWIEDRREFWNVPNYDFIQSISTDSSSAITSTLNTTTRDLELSVNVDDVMIEKLNNKLQLKDSSITADKIVWGELVDSISAYWEAWLKWDISVNWSNWIKILQSWNSIIVDWWDLWLIAVKDTIDYITPSNLQTVFTLTDFVTSTKWIRVRLNWIMAKQWVDWTSTLNQLTWLWLDLDIIDELSIEWFQSLWESAEWVYNWIEDVIVPINWQTVFTMSQTTLDEESVLLFINNVSYTKWNDWTILWNDITWINTSFTISDTDNIEIRYVVQN